MHDPANVVASWWSYAEGDSTVLGVVVAVLAIAGLAFVGSRVLARARRRR
jgi:hypothetical protein